jgi:hypothetical protein
VHRCNAGLYYENLTSKVAVHVLTKILTLENEVVLELRQEKGSEILDAEWDT